MPALRLDPVLVPKPWGGRRLAALGRALPADVAIGESWDVADLAADQTTVAEPLSRVLGGEHDGRSLGELVARHRTWLLGAVAPTDGGRFPLLVKSLDATQHLSVQVHPTPATVGPGEHLKTESWVVLEAAPGATVMLGLRDGTTRAQFTAAVGTPAVVELLRHVPVAVGDVLHLPTGTIHALGAGVVVAEVQTPSDTTYRLYDWTEELGRAPRQLHVGAGTRAVLDAWDDNVRPPVRPGGDGLLVEEPAYSLARHRLADGVTWRATDHAWPHVLIVLDGDPHVGGEVLRRGAVRLLPAGADVAVVGPGEVLLAWPNPAPSG